MNGGTKANQQRLKYKGYLTALVGGLAVHVLLLAQEGMLPLLSPARRVLLVIIAIRILTQVQASLTTDEQEQLTARTSYKGWRAAILPFSFITPPLVVSWLAWWSTGGRLAHTGMLALAMSAIMLLLVINLVYTLVKSRRATPVEADSTQQQGVGNFWLDGFFYTSYGFLFALGVLGVIMLSPETIDDTSRITNLAFYFYLLWFVVQGVFRFFFNLVRYAKETSGVHEQELRT